MANCYRNEPSFHLALNEILVPGERSEKLDVRRHTNHLILVQGLPQHPQRLRPIPTMHDQLRNHRVVEHTDL